MSKLKETLKNQISAAKKKTIKIWNNYGPYICLTASSVLTALMFYSAGHNAGVRDGKEELGEFTRKALGKDFLTDRFVRCTDYVRCEFDEEENVTLGRIIKPEEIELFDCTEGVPITGEQLKDMRVLSIAVNLLDEEAERSVE